MQGFVEATRRDGSFTYSQYDGIFGLGYSALAVNGVTPPLYNMYYQGLIRKPIVSFYLNRNGTGTGGSEIVFGGSDPNLYKSAFVYAPVVNAGFWKLRLDQIIVGNSGSMCSYGCLAIVDTGTSLIAGPPNEIAALHQLLGAKINNDLQETIFDCATISKLPIISFVVSNTQLYLLPEDYIIKVSTYISYKNMILI